MKVVLFSNKMTCLPQALLERPGIDLLAVVDCSDDGCDLSAFARKNRLELFCRADLNDKFVKWSAETRPDVFAVYALHFLLPPRIFRMPKYGTLNLHPSLLPLYAGAEPWASQIRDHVVDSGYTVFRIDEGVDTGPILAQTRFRIDYSIPIRDFSNKILQQVGADFYCRIIADVDKGGF